MRTATPSHRPIQVLLLTAVLGVAPCRDLAAQDGATARLTLNDAVARAFQASHRVAERRATEEGARAAIDATQAADRPQFSVLAGYTRTNHVLPYAITFPLRPPQVIYPDVPDNYRFRLDAQWPVYTFGRTAAAEGAASAEAQAAAKDIETTRADLKLDVTRAFWGLVTARESVRVLEESLKRMDASLQDVQNRLKAGLVPPSDVLSVQAQRSRQQMLLIQARNQADLATADLARLVGMPAGSVIEPEGRLDQPAPDTGHSDADSSAAIQSFVAEAKRARPDREAIARRVLEADERQQAARAGNRPVVGVAAGVDYARPNARIFPRVADFQESWDASVNFSWAFWDGGRTKADVAQAAAAERALRERLAEFDSLIELDVRQRWLEVQSSRAAVAAAADAVAAASESRRVLGERFDAGVATSTDVLDAQVALLQAELDRTNALANLRLAEARLERAIGR